MRGKPARPWKRAAAWLAVLAPFFYLSYGFATWFTAQRASVPSIVFAWESQVPFWPWTIFPYWTINAFYGLSIFLASTRHELDRHAQRLLSAQVMAVLCFLAMPLAFSFGQPPVDGAPGALFAALRSFDKPFNQAPSLHIALALILWDFYQRRIHSAWARAVLHAWAFLICASVLSTWQHHFIDIPTGALLGLLCCWAWPLERRASPLFGWHFSADPVRRRLALCYALGALACAALGTGVGGGALWLWWPAASLALVSLNYLALGARGFQMDACGRMAWPARWLFGPYRFGAWLNARLWTRRLASDVEVIPGVRLGRLPDKGSTEAGVVSLCAELQGPDTRGNRCLPWLDLVPASAASLQRAAALIERLHRERGRVRVCCALGFSRSAAALACWLVRSGRAADVDEAVALLRRTRPQLVLHAGWMASLRQAGKAISR